MGKKDFGKGGFCESGILVEWDLGILGKGDFGKVEFWHGKRVKGALACAE